MRPDDRVLYARLLLDVDALAENRVDNLRAGLDGAVIGDDGEVVNLCVRRRVERAAPLFELDAADAPREYVVVNLQVARGRTDVNPVGVGGHVRVELLAALEEVWEEAVLEGVVLARGHEVQDLRVEDVGAGVNRVAAYLVGLRL